MNRFHYRLMYWFRQAPWDSGMTPPELVEAFQAGDFPPGPALDLGCGTGTNVIYMAKQGRQAFGLDFVPTAIAKARRKSRQAGVSDRTQFLVADVTRIHELNLPQFSFALDMGCFHGLDTAGQRRYIDGLSALLVPGGQYLLYAISPGKQAGRSFGVTAEHVQAVFTPAFDIRRIERGEFRGSGSAWFWMKRKGIG